MRDPLSRASDFLGQVVQVTACFAGANLQYRGTLEKILPPLPSGKGGGLVLHETAPEHRPIIVPARALTNIVEV